MCGQISSVTATSAAPAAAANAYGVVEQRLVRADLDQRRRKPTEVGKQRRNPRVLSVDPRRNVCTGQFLQIPLVDQRIDGVLADHRRARHRQIGPRRNEPDAGRAALRRRRADCCISAIVRPPPALSPPTAMLRGATPARAETATPPARHRTPPETDAPATADIRPPAFARPRRARLR